ncbi:MAG: hypothetical protein ABIJ37_07980 [Pseudomonadota bacterium]
MSPLPNYPLNYTLIIEQYPCFSHLSRTLFANAAPGCQYQFERLGYFSVDSINSSNEKLVFNRTVTLRVTWVKIAQKEKG